MMYLGISWHIMGNKIERESSKPCKIGGILLKVNAGSNFGILVLYAGAKIWVSYPWSNVPPGDQWDCPPGDSE